MKLLNIVDLTICNLSIFEMFDSLIKLSYSTDMNFEFTLVLFFVLLFDCVRVS